MENLKILSFQPAAELRDLMKSNLNLENVPYEDLQLAITKKKNATTISAREKCDLNSQKIGLKLLKISELLKNC